MTEPAERPADRLVESPGDRPVRRPMRRPVGRLLGYGLGGGLILTGLGGLVVDARLTDPLGWALWFGGLVVAHDAVLVPLVLLAGVATGMLPGPVRAPSRIALITAGVLTLVALPMVSGIGRRADDPSVLPLDYGRNLLVVLGAIALATGAAVTVSAVVSWFRRRAAGGTEKP